MIDSAKQTGRERTIPGQFFLIDLLCFEQFASFVWQGKMTAFNFLSCLVEIEIEYPHLRNGFFPFSRNEVKHGNFFMMKTDAK